MHLLLSVLLALTAASLLAQDRKPLEAKDYGQWESLRGSGTLSPDGSWLAYGIGRSNGKDELRLKQIGTGQRHVFAYGRNERFSDDSRWLAWLVGVSEEKREQLEKAKKPVQSAFQLRELASGETLEIAAVQGFRFSEDGRHIAIQRYRPKDRKKGGADLVVRNLDTGDERCFGNVGDYAWCEQAALLAMIVDTEDTVGGGVHLLDADTGVLRVLDSHRARYTGLAWREDAADLAFLRITEHDDDKDEQPSHVVIAWRGLAGTAARKSRYDHRESDAFPAGMRVVARTPSWHDDGEAVFFGIRSWDRPPPQKKTEQDPKQQEADGDEPEAAEQEAAESESEAEVAKATDAKSLRESLEDPADVDVWHSQDVHIIPRQKKTAARDRSRSQLCAFWLDGGRFVRLGDDTVDTVRVLEQGAHALGLDTTRHERERMFGPELSDVYVIDTRTGERRRVLEKHKFVFDAGPDGNHLLYVEDDTWHALDLRSNESRPLTAGIDADFINDERGVLTDENPPYGIAGWIDGFGGVLLNSRFDVWMIPFEGDLEPVCMTAGAERQIRHRILDLDPDEQWVDMSKPIYMSLFGEQTKKSGFAAWIMHAPQELRYVDGRLGGLQKARHADVFAFSEQTLTDSPDVFVAGPFLAEPKQVTHTNAQQDEYAWSPRAELVDYRSERGAKLQGALFYPADYEPGRQHPMIVYIYEKRSQNLHSYTAPSERRPYNPSVFTSLGYFVYQPDIVYRAQNPGRSALECVVPAVQAVLDKGEVDPAKVGLVGHSWGAYQTAFIVTRSDMFAAGVAGAPLTNMMSMSMSIYWNSGGTDARIFHESQGRMDKPFWQDVETYMANSPIFGMDSLATPLLIAFGDEDGAVDWHQGIEMYNAARLAEKQLVMLVYDGENHGLRKKPNQVDYHWRVREWFGHYVKGEPAPEWITSGTTFLDREEQLKALKRARKAKGKAEGKGKRGTGDGGDPDGG